MTSRDAEPGVIDVAALKKRFPIFDREIDGQIVDSGGPELAERLEREGYEAWRG